MSPRSATAIGPPFCPASTFPQRRLPAHLQYATASHQSTPLCGMSSAPPTPGANVSFHLHSGACELAAIFASRNALYCFTVTSVLSMQKLFVELPARTMSGPPSLVHGPFGPVSIFASGVPLSISPPSSRVPPSAPHTPPLH